MSVKDDNMEIIGNLEDNSGLSAAPHLEDLFVFAP